MSDPTARTIRLIKAEALREAVAAAEQTDPRDHPFTGHDEMAEWLTRRAERLEKS